VPPALKAGGPTRYPDTSVPEPTCSETVRAPQPRMVNWSDPAKNPVELPGSGGHLILGGPRRKEAGMGRPAKCAAEFGGEAIVLVNLSGRPVAEVARSVEIAEGTLWNWVKLGREATERVADPDALSESERAELKRLRKQTAQQEIDLEILRKATAYFARETNR